MKKITLTLFFLIQLFSPLLSQSNFQYLSNFHYSTQVNDVVEWNGNFYMVGQRDSLGTSNPRITVLDQAGNFLADSILPAEGYFSNIHLINDKIYISATIDFFFIETVMFGMDSSLNIVNFININDDLVNKSRVLNDSMIILAGYYEDLLQPAYLSWVCLLNINTESSLTVYQNFNTNKVEVYDVLPNPNGYYLFLNTPDSLTSNQTQVYELDHDLYTIDSNLISTSYNQFISNSPLLGPVTAMPLSDSTFMLNGKLDRPRYANQLNSTDIGLMILDSSLNEINLDFAGKTDTNAQSGSNAIANLDGYFYLGNTENSNGDSEFMVSKSDSLGNILWTNTYSQLNTSLKLNKILATADNHLLLVGSYLDASFVEQLFVIKTDTALSSLNTALNEINFSTDIKIYPNPFRTEFTIEFNGTGFLDGAYISLFDLNGNLIKQFNFNYTKHTIECANLSSGIYFVQIHTNFGVFYHKLIKS